MRVLIAEWEATAFASCSVSADLVPEGALEHIESSFHYSADSGNVFATKVLACPRFSSHKVKRSPVK